MDVRFADETEMEQLYYNYGEAHLLDDSGRTYAQIIRTGTILIKFALCLVQSVSIAYICLLRNMKEKSLAVIACDGKDTMSVRVPDGFLELHRSFKIHSKQFVYETLIGWGLNPEKTYSFKGEYLEEQKMVVFSLKNTD